MANDTDEYALLLARYGQPNRVVVTRTPSVTLRTAIYDAAHVAIRMVPNKCILAYEFYLAQKEASSSSPETGHARTHRPKSREQAPGCAVPPNDGSTIVGYEDPQTGSSLTAEAAQQSLDTLTWKSSAPVISQEADPATKPAKASPSPLASEAVRFDQETFRAETQRLRERERGYQRDRLLAFGLLPVAVLLFVTGTFVHRNSQRRRWTKLVYELDETGRRNQSVLEQSFKHLARSQAIWRVIGESLIYDWKRNAGASSILSRTRVAVQFYAPPRVEANVAVYSIDLGPSKLYFLPDTVLYWQAGAFGGIDYADLHLEFRPTRFIEDEYIPADALQIDQTWRYVRKDGRPDLRFNNNRRIPVMQYGAVNLTSSRGLNIFLHVSSLENAAAFVNCVLEYKSRLPGSPGAGPNQTRPNQERPKHTAPDIPASHANALQVLGLQPGASPEKISEAYHNLAQMYHPDKVAGLAPEYQEIAERRMKEINAAYHLLKTSTQTW